MSIFLTFPKKSKTFQRKKIFHKKDILPKMIIFMFVGKKFSISAGLQYRRPLQNLNTCTGPSPEVITVGLHKKIPLIPEISRKLRELKLDDFNT